MITHVRDLTTLEFSVDRQRIQPRFGRIAELTDWPARVREQEPAALPTESQRSLDATRTRLDQPRPRRAATVIGPPGQNVPFTEPKASQPLRKQL